MKKLIITASMLALTVGCMSPNWVRLVPENKDADIVVSTIYGVIQIHTRVNPAGTNTLPALPKPIQ